MHPQSSDKRIGKFVPVSPPYSSQQLETENTAECRDFFDALELCHANVWAKWTGGCNKAKRELNKCLHSEVTPFWSAIPLFADTLISSL
jgi:hypothetical protein